jgi:hypothetical protein
MKRLIGLAFILAMCSANAPEPGSEDADIMRGYENWILRQKTPDGKSICCDVSDGRPVWARIKNGHWEAYVTREKWHDLKGPEGWRKVPDELVVHEDNPIGWPILWVFQGEIRCFRTPTMS